MSLAEIEAIGLFRVSTTTFWPKDDGVYEGVLLSSLLKHVGLADVKELTIWAVDGFSQNIPREDWIMWPILLATRRDGKAMTRRQKGPTRIIYPRDLAPILKDDRYHLRWVWMINEIEKTKN